MNSYESRPFVARSGRSTHGRSIVYITCPFCAYTMLCYRWSIAGSGRRCPCGAKHVWTSQSSRRAAQPAEVRPATAQQAQPATPEQSAQQA